MSRIAFISALTGVPWGGSEALWSQTAASLQQRGHAIFANTHWWPQVPQQLQQLERDGVQLTRRRLRERTRLLDDHLLRGRIQARTYSWLDKIAPDIAVLSLESHCAGRDWMEACIVRNIPYIAVIQAVADHRWPGDTQQQSLATALKKAQKLFFVSHRNHQQTSIQLADNLAHARVIRNPFNVDYNFKPQWPEGKTLRLACVGRLDPGDKGQDLLLLALASEKWRQRDFQLTFFGDGPHLQSVMALSDAKGLQGKVAHGGFTSNVESIWAANHALALASRTEGLPIVVVEAMLCGRPCVVTDIAGNAELMQNDISGFVAQAPTVEFVAEALERLWQSWQNGQLESIGQNAAQAVRKQVPSRPAEVFADEIESALH